MKQLRPYQQEIVDKIRKKLKTSKEPILVNASVGSGKSLILSTILLDLERAGMRALCLTLNSTLIKQNADTYNLQNGDAGIYCAGLNSKCYEKLVIFASPHSICQGIRNKDEISRQPFQLIVIDECHNISPHDNNSMYMRIINHYGMLSQQSQYNFRIIGLTGTPYRGKGISIVGDKELFKSELCAISTNWLIENGYLVKPTFGIPQTESFDFSQLRVQNTGRFDQKQLQFILDENERLTGKIMREIAAIVSSNHTGAFIFASTRKHCFECAKSLPDNEWAIITGETPHEERRKILEAAKKSQIRYLISVNCLNVGVDVPNFDVCVWLRPTESLVLYTQGIGRVLRLNPDKISALVLDFAGNLERHGHVDDPIINEAIQQKDESDPDYCIPCYKCTTNNTVHARRCIGLKDNKRCDYFFDFKECPKCNVKNDLTSRYCRNCEYELIDPNLKLKKEAASLQRQTFAIRKASYSVSEHTPTRTPIIRAVYISACEKHIYESYMTNTSKSKNVFYAAFVRMHFKTSSKHYPWISQTEYVKAMISQAGIETPHSLVCVYEEDNWKIKRKLFH